MFHSLAIKRNMQVIAEFRTMVYQGNSKKTKRYVEITSRTNKKTWFGWKAYNTMHNFYNLKFDHFKIGSHFSKEGTIVCLNFEYVNLSGYPADFSNVRFDFSSGGTAEHGVGYYDKEDLVRTQHVDAC